jgi:hypothetical protein
MGLAKLAPGMVERSIRDNLRRCGTKIGCENKEGWIERPPFKNASKCLGKLGLPIPNNESLGCPLVENSFTCATTHYVLIFLILCA